MTFVVFVAFSYFILLASFGALFTFGVLVLTRIEQKELSLIALRRNCYTKLQKKMLLGYGLPCAVAEGICLFVLKGCEEAPSLSLMAGAFFAGFTAELCFSSLGLLFFSILDHKILSGTFLFLPVLFYAFCLSSFFQTSVSFLSRSIKWEILTGACFLLLFILCLTLSKHCYQKHSLER